MPICPKCRREFRENVKSCYYCDTVLVDDLAETDEIKPVPRAKRIYKYSRTVRVFNSAGVVPVSDPDPLVTIENFGSPREALDAQMKLISHNIKSYFANGEAISTGLQYSGVLGGIKLQVRTSEAKNAMGFLKTVETPDPDKSIEQRDNLKNVCSQCNSENVRKVKKFFTTKWRCDRCGYEWKYDG
jgi:hypothetical protein